MAEPSLTRRSVLRAIGGGCVVGSPTTFAVGPVAGRPTDRDQAVANVGYVDGGGRDAVLDAASAVLYEFGFDALTARVPASEIPDLAARPDVRYVERDATIGGILQPRPQPRRQLEGTTVPYGVELVGADVATDAGVTGADADVAVLDTGIDSTHSDLAANLGESVAFVPGIGDVEGLGFPAGQDDDVVTSHGTHCSGTIGALDNSFGVTGVSTEATLHAVKALLGGVGAGSNAGVAAGLEFVADRGWDVANMSFGGPEPSAVLADAVADAHRRGVLLVAAAGNDGMVPSDPPASDPSSTVGYPAAYDEVVAVGATDRNDGIAPFSSTGPAVEIVAPGVDVLSTALPVNLRSTREEPIRRYVELSGTSFAAPHVTGAGALLMADGDLSNVEARERLNETAADVGLADAQQGSGRLDVAAALGLD